MIKEERLLGDDNESDCLDFLCSFTVDFYRGTQDFNQEGDRVFLEVCHIFEDGSDLFDYIPWISGVIYE